MLTLHWKSRVAILTTLAVLGTITLYRLTNFKALVQALSDQSSQCTDVEISQHIQQLDTGEPSAFDALVACKSQAVPALIEALGETQDEEVRIIIIAALGQIGSQAAPAIPILNESLKDNSEDVQLVVVHALGQVGKEAVPALIAALEDEDIEVSQEAVYVLGNIGKEAVPALIAALEDKDSGICFRAADALREIGVKAIPDLIEALYSTDSNVRSGAAYTLGKFTFEAKEAVPALIDALRDEDNEVRERAANALGQIGPAAKEAVPALIDALKDEEGKTNLYAAVALVKVGGNPQDAIPVLIANLQGNPYCDWNVKLATETLEKIGKEAVPALTTALKDMDWNLRFGATRALGQIGVEARDAVPELTEVFLDRNENIRIRSGAMTALENIASEEALSVLNIYKEEADNISYLLAQKKETFCFSKEWTDKGFTNSVKMATTQSTSKPPAMCKIRVIRSILRWKCP